MADWRYNRRPGFATATRAPRQQPLRPTPTTSSPIAAAMTITAFAVLWDYGLLLMLLYNMRPGTPAFTVLSTVFNLLCAAFDIVCYNFMEIIEFFLSIPIAIVVGYLNIDPAAIKYDVLYVRNACSRAVRGYLVALRERARKSVVAAWHRGCGYLDYQWKLHCWYADNINAMIVGSIEGRIREFTNECITFIYLTPPLAEVYMAGWQAWFWLLWMRDGASLLLSYLPAFHAASSRSTSATAQSTPNASRSSTPVSDNEAPVSNSSQPTTPEPQASEPQPSAQDESPRTNPAAQRERAERRERRERKKREERAARKREADLRAARSKEERERRQLQERLAREAEERRLEQEEQERQRQMREQAAREEERQRKVQEQAALEKERQRKAQELAALEKERQRKAQEQAALEKARSQSTAGQWLKQAIAKAATEQKTQPQPVVPLASAGTASLQLPKTLPPVVLQKTTGPTLPFSLSAAPVMAANPPRTPTTASTQPPSQSTPQPQAPILQQRPAMNLQPRLGQGQNVPQQLRPQPQQSAVGTPAGSLASPSGLQAFPTFFASGTAQQRPATGLPFPISTSTSAPAAPVTLAPPASAPPSQPQPQQQRTPEEIRLTVLARIAALKQEAQQLQTPSQTQQQPQQPSTQLPMLYAQPTPTPTVAAPSAASGQPTLFPANTLQVTPSSNQTATHNDAFSGAAVGSSMPAFSSSITSIHPINIPEPQAVAEPMEIDIPMPFIHNPSPPPQSDLMDVDDIEMEDAWEADCSATLSSDILPLSAPPTMEVDDELPESWPSPVWFPLATPQPSRPVTPAPLSPPPAVVRSPEIVMEVVAAPQNAPAPPPVATPPKPSPPRQVTTPTTFSVPLKPTSTAASASSSVPSTNGTTPKPAQGPSASTPPKATSNVSKQPAIPAKPTDPSKAPAPAPAAPKAGPSSIPQSSAPAKPSSVTPPASQAVSGKSSPSASSSTPSRTPAPSGPSKAASPTVSTSTPSAPTTAQPAVSTTQNSPLSSPPAASRVDAGSAKAPANTSTAKPPLRKFGFALTKRPTEKKEETEDKPILFKDKRQFPPDAKKPAGPSVASSQNAAKGQPAPTQSRPRTSILRPASSTSTPTSPDVKMSNAPSAASSLSPARSAPVKAACNTTTAATSSLSSNSAPITSPVITALSLPSSSSSTKTDSVMGDSSSSCAVPAPLVPTPTPSTQADNNGAPAQRRIRNLPKKIGDKEIVEYTVATPIVDPGESQPQNAEDELEKAADAASNSSQANPNLARADAMFDDDDDDGFTDFDRLVGAADPDAPVFASPAMDLSTDPTFLALTMPMSLETLTPAVSQQGLAASSTSTPTSTQPTYASSSSPSSAPSDPSSFPPGRPNPKIRLVPLVHERPAKSSSAPSGEATDMNTLCLRQLWDFKDRRLQNFLIYGDTEDLIW